MIRDTRKDEKYFADLIATETARFEKFYSKAQQKAEIGDNEAAKRAYIFAMGIIKNKMIALYSAGATVSDITKDFSIFVSICEKVPQLTYDDLLLVASLAVLLKPKEDIICKVKKLLYAFTDDDMLMEGFKSYFADGEFSVNSNIIKYNAYDGVKSILTVPEKEAKITALINYVSNVWYDSLSESSWYNTHLNNKDTYYGYWCFIGAALAVVYSLDVNDLRKIEYIPVDLL